jgi:uncharacterized protein YjbI with pentapeptide repeats
VTVYVNNDLSVYPKLRSGAYDLRGANMKNGSVVRMSLRGADFTGSTFRSALLIGANLDNARVLAVDFAFANLTGANLAGADLNGNFRNATFTRANLDGARISNTDLRGAKGLSTATLTGVVWTNTLCPDGTNSNANGRTCAGHLN